VHEPDQVVSGIQPSTARRNRAACAAVHTATAGCSPVRRQCSVRAGVHTTARGRRALGSSARLAGLPATSPRRTAAFSGARNAARTRFSVAAVWDQPHSLHGRDRPALAGLSAIRPLRTAVISAARSGADPVQRRCCHRCSESLVLADDRGKHRLHMGRRQLRQQNLPQARCQVHADAAAEPPAAIRPWQSRR
jgi:hypothetical protein